MCADVGELKNIRKISMKNLIIVSCLLYFTGCSYLFNGSTAEVKFQSSPEGASVQSHGGDYIGDTPTTGVVHKKLLGTTTVAFTKDGYNKEYVVIGKRLDPLWAIWDIGTCVIPVMLCIPLVVDAITGGAMVYDDTAIAKMTKFVPQPSAIGPANPIIIINNNNVQQNNSLPNK